MILMSRCTTSRLPEDNFAVAACDGCGTDLSGVACQRREGPHTTRDLMQVEAKAVGMGWAERWMKQQEMPRHRVRMVVRLLCLGCRKGERS
jgi:hypothetical protein